MNLFQTLALIPLLVMASLTVRGAVRGQIRKRVAFLWLLLWLGAAAALVWPRSTVFVAERLGIGRGADLVLYVGVLLSLSGFFYVYTRFRRLDRQITLLVRAVAIENAHLPTPLPVSPPRGTAKTS